MDKNSKCETAPEGRRKIGRPKTALRSTVKNDAYWGGTAGMGPVAYQLTERAGGMHFSLMGHKRTGEVR